MSPLTRLLAAQMGLPPARYRDVAVDRGLRVPMWDGTVLVADRYYPRETDTAPLVLIRCPYGRGGGSGLGTVSAAIAERGYQVVLQSTRGTFDSGGELEPGVHEPGDGMATVEWLRGQPWYPGSFVTYGPSYLGYVQWALAMAPIPEWRAAAIGVAPSDWCSGWTHRDRIFSLGNALYWLHGIEPKTRRDTSTLRLLASLSRPRRLRRAERQMPVDEADRTLLGHAVGYYRRWVADKDYPTRVDFRAAAANLPPVHLAAGWFDFFLPSMLTDYAALRRAGRPVRLYVGPGKHESFYAKGATRDAFSWLAYHGQDCTGSLPDTPVRVYLIGANRWVDLADWPPAESVPTPWFPCESGSLTQEPAVDEGVSRYRYDPAEPTPNVGGAYPDLPYRYGRKDNRRLEARADVLTFTTAPLGGDVDVIGAVGALLYVRSSLAHTDFFVRLCDVDRRGRSLNVCDGILRLRPCEPVRADDHEILRVQVDLAGTAYRFRVGHCIRLQISSGAHPRYTRNPGTDEPHGMRAAEQEIFHSAEYPSAITLPLWQPRRNQ